MADTPPFDSFSRRIPGVNHSIANYNVERNSKAQLKKLYDQAISKGPSKRFAAQNPTFQQFYSDYLNSQMGSGVTPGYVNADANGGILNQILAKPALDNRPSLDKRIPTMDMAEYRTLAPEDQRYVRDFRMAHPRRPGGNVAPAAAAQNKPRFDYKEGDVFNLNKAPATIQGLAGLYQAYNAAHEENTNSWQNARQDIPDSPNINIGDNGGVIPRFQGSVFGPQIDANAEALPEMNGFRMDIPATATNTAVPEVKKSVPAQTDGGAYNYIQQFNPGTPAVSIPQAQSNTNFNAADVAAPQSFMQQYRNSQVARTVARDDPNFIRNR